jgi:hypothetical protein
MLGRSVTAAVDVPAYFVGYEAVERTTRSDSEALALPERMTFKISADPAMMDRRDESGLPFSSIMAFAIDLMPLVEEVTSFGC